MLDEISAFLSMIDVLHRFSKHEFPVVLDLPRDDRRSISLCHYFISFFLNYFMSDDAAPPARHLHFAMRNAAATIIITITFDIF